MSLQVHRAERADRLVAALGELLATPLPDAFALEVVAVPARGVERWITQRLSHRLGRRTDVGVDADGGTGRGAGGVGDAVAADGICAGVRFPSPTALIAEVVGVEDHDPWAPDSLVWPLLDTIDACAGEPWCRPLGEHLGAVDGDGDAETAASSGGFRRGRRYAVARRLAGLFDSYAAHRPAMITAWRDGDDVDGLGEALPPDLRWQAELWRRLRERVAGPGPVERLAEALDRLRADPGSVALPDRVSLFGATRLTASQRAVLAGLAEHRDVHLWLPHPSPELWRNVAALAPGGPVRRSDDPTAGVPRHPLLSSLGRDVRELQLGLPATVVSDVVPELPTPELPTTAVGTGGQAGPTLLALLQADLRDDRRPEPAPRSTISADDRSVQVHACHGAARQVEVLREVLVGLLADDSTLEPRDVLVMCPDVEVYAPLISAAFGLADVVDGGHPAHELRVRLADRALSQTNPLLATVARLLELADGRVTASQVLDLAAWPPVRRRFRFDDDDLERLSRWVADAGVRWGLDAEHRSAFGLADYPQNTWRAGLDRILLGVAMAEEDRNWLGLALPLDDVGSSDVDLAGRLAELLDRLECGLDDLTGEQPVESWLDALRDAVECLTAVGSAEAWQVAELHRELRAVAEAAGERAGTTPVGLTDVRALFAGRLGGRPTRANFRTGTLTVCTMVPMRSVPHRVICLLGLDDGAFPRGARIDGDDVLARDPAVGERDPRGEDRQLMLDAMLAATEHLVITYTGADERTGAVRPPSVPLGELLDALDDTAETVDGEPARAQVVVRHPLQPFDPRAVTPGALGRPGPFSFDATALAGARAATGTRSAPPPFLAEPLQPLDRPALDLAELVPVLQRPVRGFLRQRLDVALRYEEPEPTDALAVELDNLQLWSIGERLLRDRLTGADEETCQQAEWRRGVLPPGRLGARALLELLAEVEPIVAGSAPLREPAARSVDVTVPLGASRVLRGTVPGVHGDRVVTVGYRRLGPGQRLRSWIFLLALAAAHPDVAWTAVTVGRGRGGPQRAAAGPVDPALAHDVLDQLVDLHDRALREPLPLALKSTAAYADARLRDDVPEAVRRARREWATDRFPGEDADPWHVQVWGQATPFEALLRPEPGADERWRTTEPTRFGQLAMRLWEPVLAHEQVAPL